MPQLCLASWNVNSLKVRLPQVLEWLELSRTDALVLQETKLTDDLFPAEAFREAGFDAVFTGQKTYNGVALVTRKSTVRAPEAVELNIPGYPDDQKRFVSALLAPAAEGDPIRFCGAYFPNGQEIGTSKYLYKLDWISTLSRHLRKLLEASPRLILGGDFNIAPVEADTWNPAYWEGKILCSPAERSALRRLEALGLRDSFRLFSQPAETFSWWDYRQSGFEKNHGLRIDLMLVSDTLVPLVKEAAIDVRPRGNAQPSDHAPATLLLEY